MKYVNVIVLAILEIHEKAINGLTINVRASNVQYVSLRRVRIEVKSPQDSEACHTSTYRSATAAAEGITKGVKVSQLGDAAYVSDGKTGVRGSILRIRFTLGYPAHLMFELLWILLGLAV